MNSRAFPVAQNMNLPEEKNPARDPCRQFFLRSNFFGISEGVHIFIFHAEVL